MTVAAGQPAPAFDLPADGGGRVRLEDFAGRPLVLYFYPKDDTAGCTKEAQGFAAALPEFGAAGVAVVGVSKDSVASHDSFKAKYGLPFALASDEDGGMVEAYGSWVE
jgi:peroxiredoxin Q/BCP